MIVILGAGISGISAAYHLDLKGLKSEVYEKNDSWGGLCDNFEKDGFRFDYAIHLSFTKNEYVKNLFANSANHLIHTPEIGNYYKGCWLKHPAQNNLYPLPVDEKVKVIKDFINADKTMHIENYEAWLRSQYGKFFAENFPLRYTRKYWTVEAKKLTTNWIGNRMYRPDLEEVLRGAMTGDTPNTYYAQEMRYPVCGGFKAFLSGMVGTCDIRLRKKAISIDTKKKKVEFADGTHAHYERLVSSIPLPELIDIIKDSTEYIREAAKKLAWTSVALISLGFNRPDIPQYLWFYIYDEEIFPARAYSPSKKSKNNVPEGYSSLQFEIYYSKYGKLRLPNHNLVEHIIKKSAEMGIFDKKDIVFEDYRIIKYANVIFNENIDKMRDAVLDYLKQKEIIPVGRFGEWDYYWSDQSLLSGKKISEMEKV